MPVSRESDASRCHHGLRRQTIVQSLLADVFQGRLHAGEPNLMKVVLAPQESMAHQ